MSPSSVASSSTGSDGGYSDWNDEVELSTQSLFDDSLHPTPDAAIQHDATKHGFDLRQRHLDMYQMMRLVNLIRKEHLSPEDASRIPSSDPRLTDDALLAPVIPDDPLLQYSFDDAWSDGPSEASISVQLSHARAEAAALRSVIDTEEPEAVPRRVDNDSHYFDSYSENEIHEIMLKDTVRTTTYGKFILSNPEIFNGATVLDVGCGTGILSMFAARAGAKKVYAVDASALVGKTREIIAINGFSDVIEVINRKMEELDLPEPVDVIISEWMGYMLLYESMLDSVLDARDRFLKPTGLMAPSQAKVLLSGITGDKVHGERVGFWKNIYGFDMSAMSKVHQAEGLIENVPHSEVVTDDVVLRDINIHSATPRSLDFNTAFDLTATRSCTMRAFLTHFDVFFELHRDALHPGKADATKSSDNVTEPPPITPGPVSFTTGTRGDPTHWQQVAFLLKEPIELAKDAHISGQFYCRKSSSNTRELDVEIHYTLDKTAERRTWTVQTYTVR
ncbi:S-adenosyl-L-methionine-dependent methyltransferase [Kockovaella imperatae]|uniref:type I protein arginine methyltransferase n=1 Tax=Kockovaella imperatae TaxID=4999 RepID=A0A1Y1UIG0_9TREE|nr:S-adenosyl-L-methionine-dependent methyltransferase [Kockovaella imperatae]ORX37779.1 S-adenosyl-L-methionine-dependent methyltransferase [Kockovaella imperatae]